MNTDMLSSQGTAINEAIELAKAILMMKIKQIEF